MQALRNFGAAVSETIEAARDAWWVFQGKRRAARQVRKEFDAWDPMTHYVTKGQHDAEIRGLWANINGVRNLAHQNRERIEALERGSEKRSRKPVERTWFCPNGHNVFTTTEIDPECGACGTTMTHDQDAFEAACERSDINRYGPM